MRGGVLPNAYLYALPHSGRTLKVGNTARSARCLSARFAQTVGSFHIPLLGFAYQIWQVDFKSLRRL